MHRPAPTTPCELYGLLKRHRTRGPTTRLFGRHSKSVWGAYHRSRQAWPLASLPAVHGGLGLQSAERTAPAAYWAAWMDALPVIRSRLPGAVDRCLAALEQSAEGCLREAAAAKNLLQREGWEACPGWHAAYEGARAPQPRDAGPGEWPHGWQFHATRTRNLHYRDRVPSSRALLRSQGGAHAGAWLSAVPSEPALTLAPQAMQLALRRRLRLPLPLSPNRCGPSPGCGQQVDEYGDHALPSENRRAGLGARGPQGGRIRWASHPSTMARAHNRTWSAS